MASYTREYEYNGSSGTKLRVTLTTTATSIPNNTTTELVTVKFIHTGSSWNSTAYTASLNFNGTPRTKSFSYSGAGTITLWNFTQVVPHNTNGTKTANLTITDNRHNSPYTTSISVNDNFVLDVIPRNAIFTSVPDNIEIEKPFTVTFDRRGATTVELGIYDTTGGVAFVPYFSVEGTSFTFNLSETEKNRFYDNMPTATSNIYSFYIRSNIGELVFTNRALKIKAEIPSAPIFAHEDINATTLALTGSSQTYIQNYSDLKISLTTATAFRGATITKYTVINGSNAKDYTSSGIKTDFGKITTAQLQVKITDSRGFTSQSIITLDYIPYSNPTIQSFALNREIGVSTKADLITNGLYTNVNFGAVANKIKKVEYRKKTTGDYGAWTDITAKVTYGSGTFNNAPNQQIDGFTFGTAYTVEMRVSDELTFITRTATVSKGLFTMLIDPLYGSVGFGEIPPEENNAISIKGNLYVNVGQKLLDWFYPVGTIYETTSSNLDTVAKVNNHFGGTWEKYGAGRVTVAQNSATFNTLNGTVGAETHTLTVEEMPSHNHGRLKWAAPIGLTASLNGGGNSYTWNWTKTGRDDDGFYMSDIGGGGSHNNIQPSIVVYRYRRIA